MSQKTARPHQLKTAMAILGLAAVLATVMSFVAPPADGQEAEDGLAAELFAVPGENNDAACQDGADTRPEPRVFAQNTSLTFCVLITNMGLEPINDVQVEFMSPIDGDRVTFPYAIEGDYTTGIAPGERVLLGVFSRALAPETTARATVTGTSGDQQLFDEAESRLEVQPMLASVGNYVIEAPGEAVTVTVFAETGIFPVSGFYIDLDFYGAFVQPAIDDAGNIVCSSQFVDDVACSQSGNRVNISGSTPEGTSSSGQIELVDVTFVGLASGTSILDLDDPFLTDAMTGQLFRVSSSERGEIVVNDPPPVVLCQGLEVTINMQNGDSGRGTNGPDVILGTNGDDEIRGRGGKDVICAGDGNDDVSGGRGADMIDGGEGDDDISGGRGKDTIRGEAGNDRLRGGRGMDTIDGGTGDDELRGGRGADTCIGGADTNTFRNCESQE